MGLWQLQQSHLKLWPPSSCCFCTWPPCKLSSGSLACAGPIQSWEDGPTCRLWRPWVEAVVWPPELAPHRVPAQSTRPTSCPGSTGE